MFDAQYLPFLGIFFKTFFTNVFSFSVSSAFRHTNNNRKQIAIFATIISKRHKQGIGRTIVRFIFVYRIKVTWISIIELIP